MRPSLPGRCALWRARSAAVASFARQALHALALRARIIRAPARGLNSSRRCRRISAQYSRPRAALDPAAPRRSALGRRTVMVSVDRLIEAWLTFNQEPSARWRTAGTGDHLSLRNDPLVLDAARRRSVLITFRLLADIREVRTNSGSAHMGRSRQYHQRSSTMPIIHIAEHQRDTNRRQVAGKAHGKGSRGDAKRNPAAAEATSGGQRRHRRDVRWRWTARRRRRRACWAITGCSISRRSRAPRSPSWPQIGTRFQYRRRDQHAQAGDDLLDPAGAGGAERLDSGRRRARDSARRLRLPARARLQLSARSRRHLHLAQPDPQVQSAHRRRGLGLDSSAQRGRALLRAAQGRIDQLRGAGEGARQDPVRQPDPALSAGAHQARIRSRGLHHPHHRPGRADRQRPARTDRGGAVHRQDHDAAGARQGDRA